MDICLVYFFKQIKGSKKLYCSYTVTVACQPHPKHFAVIISSFLSVISL